MSADEPFRFSGHEAGSTEGLPPLQAREIDTSNVRF